MKTKSLLTLVTAATLLLGVTGCKKETPMEKALNATKETAGNVGDALKQAAGDAQAEAKKLAAAAESKAQEAIDKAKSLVNAGKYQDALTTLNNLGGLKLTDAQQKLVDSLKAQIKKATTEGAGAVGNLLKK
ncbi:MAG: hypothetical protein NTZ16_09260 [Verrucomicrobia bacterium]|nr:hypothetical protein [Verrucomicrobiota bacterium]